MNYRRYPMSDQEKHREFLHSISRITDRLGQVEKDYKRICDDADRIKRDALTAAEDINKAKTAIETIFNDMLKKGVNNDGVNTEH